MNSLKNNSSIHHHESASRRKFTPIQQKKGGHEHGVRQLNGLFFEKNIKIFTILQVILMVLEPT